MEINVLGVRRAGATRQEFGSVLKANPAWGLVDVDIALANVAYKDGIVCIFSQQLASSRIRAYRQHLGQAEDC